ncbi:hypothetical protein GCM10007315_07630 [Gemmobacter tilapiae]|uniref:Uncharacterized protein n=1 Tax=Neogemmobacter tilapiae TaxID=875041 RepID=A0A918WJB3_9RHOB|nr:hypothetical protein GCM10007315_07630 [Gemmobacter tilapiae]
MRSLSTRALGQPRETMPMVGCPSRRVSGTKERARSGRRLGGFWVMRWIYKGIGGRERGGFSRVKWGLGN